MPTFAGGEDQYYVSDQVSVSNGNLVLRSDNIPYSVCTRERGKRGGGSKGDERRGVKVGKDSIGGKDRELLISFRTNNIVQAGWIQVGNGLQLLGGILFPLSRLPLPSLLLSSVPSLLVFLRTMLIFGTGMR